MQETREQRLPSQYSETDIFLVDGRLYHLGLAPGELAPQMLIVGDPGRVDFIARKFLTNIETDVAHRGLRSVTGKVKETGQRISVVTSGMGTPSLEVVLSELICLFELDFKTLRLKPEGTTPRLTVIRVGTSGAIHRDTPVGVPIISRYALGLDNTGLFYDFPAADEVCVEIEKEVGAALASAAYPDARFRNAVVPYAAKASPDVVRALVDTAREKGMRYTEGITASASGLFLPQGKLVGRIPPTYPPIDRLLAAIPPVCGMVFSNFEMESSFLFHYLRGHGHRVGSVCIGVDNPLTGAFDPDTAKSVAQASEIALAALARLDESAP